MTNPTLESFFKGHHTQTQVKAFVREKLIEQGKPSLGINTESMGEGCWYRSGGCKCAVGHLIPDNKYSPDMEGYWLSSGLLTQFKERLGLEGVDIKKGDKDFLQELQDIHDTYKDNGLDFAEYIRIKLA
jgi:hypothetical protein